MIDLYVSTCPVMLLGNSFRIQECLKMKSGEESSSSGRFNPVGHL